MPDAADSWSIKAPSPLTLLTTLLISFGSLLAVWSFFSGAYDGTGLSLLGFWRGFYLFGTFGILGMGGTAIGAALGLLFGLPTRLNSESPAAAQWRHSGHMEDIAEWLTKVIVGASLVQAETIYHGFKTLSKDLVNTLVPQAPGGEIVLPSVIVFGVIGGFIYSYFYISLKIGLLYVRAEKAMNGDAQVAERKGDVDFAAVTQTAQIDQRTVMLQPDAAARPAAPPSNATVKAAQTVAAVPLAALKEPDSIITWARAQLVLNKPGLAAEAVTALTSQFNSISPDALAEGARILYRAGKNNNWRGLLRQAVAMIPRQDYIRNISIVRDRVLTLLYDTQNQGYLEAIRMLNDDALLDADKSGELYLFRACAKGQRLSAEKTTLTSPATEEITRSATDDIKRALARGQPRSWIQYLSNPDAEGKPPKGDKMREDDLEVFYDEKGDFNKVVFGPDTP